MKYKGKVYKILSNFYYVKINNDVYECKAKGKFKNIGTEILVGDNVEIEILDEIKKIGNIIDVLKRKNRLLRPSVANVDKLIITLSIIDPKPDLILLDKQIIYCLSNNIFPIICITKIDKDKKNEAKQIKEIYEKIGYKVFLTSSKDKMGLIELKKEMKDFLCVLSGNSGIGKSTLVNSICGKKIMKEGEISLKIQRGKQTTRHTEIIDFEGYMVVDTPGFSLFEINDISRKELANYFEEFLTYIEKCKYRDCMHINEEKCGIKEAVDNNSISVERYRRYIEIYNELK